MLSPLFGVPIAGAPFALLFLVAESQINATSRPAFGTYVVMFFACYGAFLWLFGAGLYLFSPVAGGDTIAIGAATVAILAVAGPFLFRARARERSASSPR